MLRSWYAHSGSVEPRARWNEDSQKVRLFPASPFARKFTCPRLSGRNRPQAYRTDSARRPRPHPKREDCKTEVKPVLRTTIKSAPAVVSLSFANAKSGKIVETIVCSREHPFMVQGVGFVIAGRLALGNSIVTRAGPPVTLAKIEWKQGKCSVYNFEVEVDHTYFVGSANGGVWVHNAGPCDEAFFRGGNDVTKVRPIDVKISDGLVQPTKGISVHMNPDKVESFGGAHRVTNIPDELKIQQRGMDPLHYEIMPKNPMSMERFRELLEQVGLERHK